MKKPGKDKDDNFSARVSKIQKLYLNKKFSQNLQLVKFVIIVSR